MPKPEVLPKRIDILDSSDPACKFRINIDVLNECFGANCKAPYMKAVFPRKNSDYFCSTTPTDKVRVWMPKLFGNSSLWKNALSSDGSYFYEIADEGRTSDWTDISPADPNTVRLIFSKAKNNPDCPYVFNGAYINESMDYMKHTYKRIATKVKLIGNPVYKVELLDDNRE